MNTEINDKLDLLIAFCAKDCGNDDVETFKSLDTSDVVLSDGFYAKQRRLINRYKRKPVLIMFRKCLVRVAVALMALMSIGFITVMAVPDLREAVFEAVVEWYDNYISIRFEPSGGENNDGTDTTSSATSSITTSSSGIHGESDSSNVAITPPEKIETVMKPTYIPEGAEEDIVKNSKSCVVIDYYLGDDLVLSFTQTPFKNKDILFDNNISNSYDVEINGNNAIAFEYDSMGYAIIWTDGLYYYQVCSTTMDKNELIKVASSIK